MQLPEGKSAPSRASGWGCQGTQGSASFLSSLLTFWHPDHYCRAAPQVQASRTEGLRVLGLPVAGAQDPAFLLQPQAPPSFSPQLFPALAPPRGLVESGLGPGAWVRPENLPL